MEACTFRAEQVRVAPLARGEQEQALGVAVEHEPERADGRDHDPAGARVGRELVTVAGLDLAELGRAEADVEAAEEVEGAELLRRHHHWHLPQPRLERRPGGGPVGDRLLARRPTAREPRGGSCPRRGWRALAGRPGPGPGAASGAAGAAGPRAAGRPRRAARRARATLRPAFATRRPNP